MINLLDIDEVQHLLRRDEFIFDTDDGTYFAASGTSLHWHIQQLIDGWSAEYEGEDVTIYTRPRLIVRHRGTGAHVRG